MSVLQEILEWSKGQPGWQRDAIRRLFLNEKLSEQDLDDLYALLKAEHGIPDPKKRQPKPLTKADIPGGTGGSEHVILQAMKDLRNVNAIAEDQRLEFGNNGITIIYGDNGTGKSGYTRVLKKACRARDQNEPILPNANMPPGAGVTAAAIFEVSINGAPQELQWQNGKSSPQELSSLAIFDSRCARAYLDEEDDFSYVPYGLDILEGLAGVCREMDGRIKEERAQCVVDTTVFNELGATPTAAGKLVAGLNANTDQTVVEQLSTLSDEELARRTELEKNLKAENPKEKATQLRYRAARIDQLAKRANEKIGFVNEAVSLKLRDLAEAYHTAKAAAELAADAFKNDVNLLPGTGGEAWKELFEAARKFAVEAYPEKDFPELGVDAPCPLCQQPLNDGAARLVRFEEFVQQEAEKKMRASRKEFAAQYKSFEHADLSLGFDDILYKEIESLDAELAKTTRDFEKELLERHQSILQACKDRTWGRVVAEPVSPVPQLKAMVASLTAEAKALEKAADEGARVALQTEFDELDARLKLGKLKTAVVAAIEKYSLAEKLSKCAKAVKTNTITMKSTELSEKVVSKSLADALNNEFKALGAGNLHVTLASRSVKGKALHKLKIELPQARNPAEILSEGEQRAIAIGSFLAEVNIGGGSGGIVFDDPVSSLDHKRRERVASRLVQEAAKRQVIIFTHDVYFLCVLMEAAERLGIQITTQSLSKRQEGFGVASPTLPFEAIGTKARVGALREKQQHIAKLFKDGNEPEFIRQTVDCYRELRIAWERAVEEVLLQNVVLRFRKGVSTQPLIGVVVEDEDYSIVDKAMTKCSNYAHDQAAMGGVAIPEPDELLADIQVLEDWRIEVTKRAKQVKNRRKTGAK